MKPNSFLVFCPNSLEKKGLESEMGLYLSAGEKKIDLVTKRGDERYYN